MMIQKVVPIILRMQMDEIQILVFRHPLAGIQIVKGTVEPNEKLEHAALRELSEESGIEHASIQRFIGIHSPKVGGADWYVYLCEAQEQLTDQWTHHCTDDGGLDFQFFWYPLFSPPTQEWHTIFQDLLTYLQEHLKAC